MSKVVEFYYTTIPFTTFNVVWWFLVALCQGALFELTQNNQTTDDVLIHGLHRAMLCRDTIAQSFLTVSSPDNPTIPTINRGRAVQVECGCNRNFILARRHHVRIACWRCLCCVYSYSFNIMGGVRRSYSNISRKVF